MPVSGANRIDRVSGDCAVARRKILSSNDAVRGIYRHPTGSSEVAVKNGFVDPYPDLQSIRPIRQLWLVVVECSPRSLCLCGEIWSPSRAWPAP